MGRKGGIYTLKRGLRNFDDMMFLVTGKRLRNIAGAAFNNFGEEVTKKASKKVAELFSGPEEPEVAPDSPYRVLGINPDAPDFLVRAAYKANMKKYHPDGESPNEEIAKKVNQAYDQICLEREMSK